MGKCETSKIAADNDQGFIVVNTDDVKKIQAQARRTAEKQSILMKTSIDSSMTQNKHQLQRHKNAN